MRVTNAFVPLLLKSASPVVLNISSHMGSLEFVSPGGAGHANQMYGYNSSKTALNAYTVALANQFKEAKVNAICPGYVSTNINGYSGQLPIEESVRGIINTAILPALDKDGPTGQFFYYNGTKVHW
eukprot:TRINITY_DN1898_c0_g1_i2.p2 TRINITY_DN1898_c0_g1~~TRINITY_DN1898_c0_g1_i2.p2  ORF type:complete len:126 (+),score=40.36 TRINITY_DN1898_c0_g1_i2:1288-1665(+)